MPCFKRINIQLLLLFAIEQLETKIIFLHFYKILLNLLIEIFVLFFLKYQKTFIFF